MNSSAILIDGLWGRLARAFDAPLEKREFLVASITEELSKR